MYLATRLQQRTNAVSVEQQNDEDNTFAQYHGFLCHSFPGPLWLRPVSSCADKISHMPDWRKLDHGREIQAGSHPGEGTCGG